MAFILARTHKAGNSERRTALNSFSGGLCIDSTSAAPEDNQSPDMLNMWYKDNLLRTRDGQRRLFAEGIFRQRIENLYPNTPVTQDNKSAYVPVGNSSVALGEDGSLRIITLSPSAGVYTLFAVAKAGRRYQVRFKVKGAGGVRLKIEQGGVVLHDSTHTLDASVYTPVHAAVDSSGGDIKITLLDTTPVNGNAVSLSSLRVVDVTELFEGYVLHSEEYVAGLDFSQNLVHEDRVSFSGRVNGISEGEFASSHVIHCGTSLYRWSGRTDEEPVYITLTRLADAPSVMWRFMDSLYILDGAHYYFLDRDFNLKEVEPYVPIVAINCSPDFKSVTVNEGYNMIGRGFEVWYNASGDTSTTYVLPHSSLSQDGARVELNGAVLSQAQYSLDRTAGRLTVSVSHAAGGLNNLRVQVFQRAEVIEESRGKILSCTIAALFGGGSGQGTRLLLSGNPSMPSHYFRSGLLDCSYFPDLDYDIIGSGGGKITAMKLQYGALVVFCEDSVYSMSYSSQDGSVLFPVKQINSTIGCDAPGSIRLIDNRLVFASSPGIIYIIDRMDGTDERNIKPISRNIAGSLEEEKGIRAESPADILGSVSADYDGCYFLNVGEHTYVWDYDARPYYDTASSDAGAARLVWYLFDNISPARFFVPEVSGALCYVARDGSVVSFAPGGDFGEDIRAYYVTKALDMGYPDVYKRLTGVTAVSHSGKGRSFRLVVLCDGAIRSGYTVGGGDFSWSAFDFGLFSLKSGNFLSSHPLKAAGRGGRFSFRFENIWGGFNISQLIIKWIAEGGIGG